MAGFKDKSILRGIRLLASTCVLAPVLAWGQSPMDASIAEIRDQVRYVPDKALVQLQKMEPAARAAPAPTKAEFLAQLSSAWRSLGQLETALLLSEELIAFGRAQNSQAILAKGLLTKAYTLSAMAERKASHQLAFEAEQLANGTADLALRVQATITSGQSYAEQGNFPAALGKLQIAVDLGRQLDDLVPLAQALNALALLYTQMKEYDKGWGVLDESVRVAEKLNSPGRLATAKGTEYGLAIDSHQPKRALAALRAGLEVARKMGAKTLVANTLVNLSDSYLKEQDFSSALRYATEALAASAETRDAATRATALVNLGQAHLGLGHLAEGKKHFDAGLLYYEKTGDQPELQVILKEYGQALERAGDLRGAVQAYHRERTISEALFEQERQKAVYDMQEKYETEKKQRQIELLSRENQVKSTELDNRRLQQRIWWLLAVVFALASAIVGLLYRKVRHANAQLEVKNLELKAQSSLDPLTSLYNRRHFQEFMRTHNQVDNRGPAGEDIVGALFLLDVDHFKHVNDTHGHAAGDVVLKMIAATLREALRETDMIVRWGGEEFLAFLPAIPRSGVEEIARRILVSISSQQIEYQNHRFNVNVSVGFAPFPLVPAETPLPWERAVNLVDMALYLAKAHGRNRAYGVRGFERFHQTSMEAIEQDLERAWRAGFVELSVVLGGAPEIPPPPGEHSNVVPLKPAIKH
ncbi:diguanylate cyclase [Massilia sp. Root418]|uniref:tetratricopeptide repeat-containing diguanylate cyclase n=1 Tax=Massilia sp. Root418 TaxID=1736532 RepID=UPI00070072D9|nr:tetratricopeptide repeat-containing diguanylate cyclase [Massilia sp. Root418]KQW96673.1 diguanylate cyclase [Massilia sp. Root418]